MQSQAVVVQRVVFAISDGPDVTTFQFFDSTVLTTDNWLTANFSELAIVLARKGIMLVVKAKRIKFWKFPNKYEYSRNKNQFLNDLLPHSHLRVKHV